MTAIRHGRELCLPGDDVEARSTSLQRNKCLHPSRHDGVGSAAILRYGWFDLSSSVFYDYCGRVCSGAHRCVPLLLLVAAAEPFVVGREGLVLGLLAWWCVSMVLHGASWRLAMALDRTRCVWGASPAAALHRIFARPLERLLLRLLRKLRRFGAPSWFLVVVAVSGSWC